MHVSSSVYVIFFKYDMAWSAIRKFAPKNLPIFFKRLIKGDYRVKNTAINLFAR